MISDWLADFLRERRDKIIKEERISYQDFDPTNGPFTAHKTIEIIDFDALCEAIDEFQMGLRGQLRK